MTFRILDKPLLDEYFETNIDWSQRVTLGSQCFCVYEDVWLWAHAIKKCSSVHLQAQKTIARDRTAGCDAAIWTHMFWDTNQSATAVKLAVSGRLVF